MKKYLFEVFCEYGHLQERSTISQVLEYDTDTTWPEVLKAFVHFLGHEYGYDLSDKVAVVEADGDTTLVSGF